MATVSVIIPVHNGSRFLGDAIRSVKQQTYPIHEIIVIDDGSEDKPEEIINEIGDTNIQLYKQDQAGAGKARNLGLTKATGDYIGFLDADDMWERHALDRRARRLEDQVDAALVYCDKIWVNEDGIPLKEHSLNRELPEGWIFGKLLETNYISSTSCVLARRSAILAVGGFNEAKVFQNAQDYELWLRIAARFRCLSISNPLVRYRIHRNNVTHRFAARTLGQLAALKVAQSLISSQNVDPRNGTFNKIHVVRRMKKAYKGTVRELFGAGEYPTVVRLALEAFQGGFFSFPVALRFGISILPPKMIHSLRFILRSAKAALNYN